MRKKNRKIIQMSGMILLIPLLSSCGLLHPAGEGSAPESTVHLIHPVQIIAENTATPEPVVIARDPVHNHSPLRIQFDAPENMEIPGFYHRIDFDGIPYCVYAYTDVSNRTVFRVFAEVDELEDENITGTLSGFFRAEIYPDENGLFRLETDKNENPVPAESEAPAVMNPCPVPTKKAIRTYIREADNYASKYERAKSDAENSGNPLPDPTPWNGLPVLSAETEVISLPSQVRQVRGYESLYFYENIYGLREYRLFATADGYDSGFYLSDEEGSIQPGALKINHLLDFDKSSFRSGRKQVLPEDYIRRLPVFVILSDGSAVSVYSVFSERENQSNE